ncbi:ABC transporter permease [Ulvibacterium sp.]|uniref:ABC transporter permease n=1 Tax=Ulvibacterium sp. TaxID=2665914 RepID=UPI003BA9A05E
MLRHHLKLFFRNIKKNKSTFSINIIGLSTGLACVLLIALWVFDELGVDKFHANDARLYQVVETPQIDGRTLQNPSTAGLLAETLAQEFPEIEYSTGVRETGEMMLFREKTHFKAQGLFAHPEFFNVFSFPLLHGNSATIFGDKNTIVISEDLAKRFFGQADNVIGETLKLGENTLFTVSGVLENIPTNSSIQFDFVIPFAFFKETSSPNAMDWNYNLVQVYLVLKKGIDITDFNAKIKSFMETRTGDPDRPLATRLFSDNYLYDKYRDRVEKAGRIAYVRLFSLISFLILVIACINFMNLSTANASRRLKEIGIKKAMGSKRNVLVSQYLVESLSMTFLSLLIALLIVALLLPQFNAIAAKQITLDFKGHYILALGIILMITGLLAGSYPAFYLSGLNAITTLKGKLHTSKGEVFARRGLVIFQFVLSTILIVSVLIVYRQLEFAQTKNLGYDKDNVVYFDIEGKARQNLDTFLAAVEQLEGVASASSISTNIVGGNNTTTRLQWPGKMPDEKAVFQIRPVNYNMIETFDIDIVQGRSFSKEYGAEESKIIFNRTAVDLMGLENPIGKRVSLENTNFEIVGVTEDFHFASLHEEIKPLFFVLRPEWTRTVMAKIKGGQEKLALGQLQDFYERYNPGLEFDYKFLDETYAAQYAAEQRVSILAKYFAGLAILISCLGLFGLATFNAERRRKEISIRKVLGQSATQVTLMLSSEFAKLVLIAMLIALPIAYILVGNWLSGFAYRIPLHIWYFLTAGSVALGVAMLTVGGQAIRAANHNPVEGLREE